MVKKSTNKGGKKKITTNKGGKKKTIEVPKMIPKYTISNKTDFASVTMTLHPEETFVVESGCVFNIKQKTGIKIKVKTKSGGIWKGLKRSLFSGETFFRNYFSAPKEGEVQITFGGNLPGDVLAITLKPGEKYNVSSGSYIGSSTNIEVSTKMRMRGVLTNEGAFTTKLQNTGTEDGIAFLSCFGKFNKITLKKNEESLVDNGMFLAAQTNGTKTLFTLTKLSGYKSFIFGGEGIFMKFKGPCEFYTQNANIDSFVTEISNRLPTRSETPSFNFE